MATMEEIKYDVQIYDTIRRNIKKYRKEKGLTSAQLAEMVGLSHDFIRQIESEKTRYNFSVETFYKISVALETGMDKLAAQWQKTLLRFIIAKLLLCFWIFDYVLYKTKPIYFIL